MIKLTITKDIPNEDYEQELKEFNSGIRRDFNFPTPRTRNLESILEVYITDEQFNAIRKAVLENF